MTGIAPRAQNGLVERVGIIGRVRNHVITGVLGDQCLRLGPIMALPPGHDEPQGVAQAIHTHVDLGAEPAAAAPQGLGGLPPRFLEAPAVQG